MALNAYIAELHARALEKHKELVLQQALITPKLILKRVFGKDTEMRTQMCIRDRADTLSGQYGLSEFHLVHAVINHHLQVVHLDDLVPCLLYTS